MSYVKVLQPEYFKRFKCISSKCKSNCCSHNWQIRIDKSTYEKYASIDDDSRDELLSNIKIVTEDPFMALTIPRITGGCPFFTEQGLCCLQLKYGFDYLCRTCMIHPRSISYIDGEFETYLDLSCEEAVRLVLFGKEPIRLEESVLEPDGSGNIIPNRMLVAEKYTSAANATEIFKTLRNATLVILQSRQYSVRVRMLILCLFIQQIEELFTATRDSMVIRFTEGFIEVLHAGTYDSLAAQMPGGVDIDMDLVLDILSEMQSKNDKWLNIYLPRALEGLGMPSADSQPPEDFYENYKSCYDTYFAGKEYIFENYLVNHVLLEGFPFNYDKETGVMKNYADLLAKYNLVEFLMTGLCGYIKKFNRRDIIDCVAAFSRCYGHSLKGYLVMD